MDHAGGARRGSERRGRLPRPRGGPSRITYELEGGAVREARIDAAGALVLRIDSIDWGRAALEIPRQVLGGQGAVVGGDSYGGSAVLEGGSYVAGFGFLDTDPVITVGPG
ncbi:MAG: hypothetical protein MPI95_03480 [Nitrosopumilus sp.]|nr:hypothetical protein [Nitrosopumilus sp.]CAI9831837.1 hypothetical protein IBTHAUMO2_450043 [Nitrosopumilaceae archaeon]MDA7943764.1 hypothetical protein [Nitrosopumilus sp.]MDA7945128.1 hypothetical protein [Nitrosopumilus sp.]MDA7955357.1 hypothetical protein [Nitrosopumilus sp.]